MIVTDKAGLQSIKEVSRETTIDPTAPENPMIVQSGTKGKNGWYTSNIELTIVPGKSQKNGVEGVYYYIEGANAIGSRSNPKYKATTSVETVVITVDGESTIYAMTKDKAGKTSNDWTKLTVKKDATKPIEGAFTVETVKNGQVGAKYAVSYTTGNRDDMSRNRQLHIPI